MRVLWSFVRVSLRASVLYRLDVWLRIVNAVLVMLAMKWLWTSLYAQAGAASSLEVDETQAVTYAVLAVVMGSVVASADSILFHVSTQVRTGAIEMDLLRPLDFQLQLFARAVGEAALVVVTLVLPCALLGVMLLGTPLPSDAATAACFGLSAVMAFAVCSLLNFLVALAALWTIDIKDVTWAYKGVTRLFSGQLVPLWVMPGWLTGLAAWMPFGEIFDTPLSIYIGRTAPSEVPLAFARQAAWCLCLWLAGRLVWARARKRIVVQGG